jgi:hypothetical protein
VPPSHLIEAEALIVVLRDLLNAERQASLDPTSEPVTLDQLDRILHAAQVDLATQ